MKYSEMDKKNNFKVAMCLVVLWVITMFSSFMVEEII